MSYSHDLDALLPTSLPTLANETGGNYNYPDQLLDQDAEFQIVPFAECNRCARAGDDHHKTYRGWRCLDKNTGETWTENNPWTDSPSDGFPQTEWLRRAQAFLFWMSKWSGDGWPSLGTLGNGPGFNEESDALGLTAISDYTFVSASGTTLTLSWSGATDPRTAMGGTPIQVGDLIVFGGNNVAAARDYFCPQVMVIGTIDTTDPHAASVPNQFTLTLSQAITPAIDEKEDLGEALTVTVKIVRETFPQFWSWFPYDGQHIMVGLKQVGGPWAPGSHVFNLSTSRLALPVEGKVGDAREIIVKFEYNDDGIWVDVTADVPDLFEPITGPLSYDPSGSGLSQLDLTAMTWTNVTGVKITSWYEANDLFDAGVHPQFRRSRCCKHSRRDPTDTWGVADANGHTWFCEYHRTASGAADFEPLCWLPGGGCDAFAPLEDGYFMSKAALLLVLRQIWFGGVPVLLREYARNSPLHQYMYHRGGVASIWGLISPPEDVVSVDCMHNRAIVAEGSQFGRVDAEGVGSQGFAHVWPIDSELPLAPSQGALLALLSSADRWDQMRMSLLDNVALGGATDPMAEYRRHPMVNFWQGLRDWGYVQFGDGPQMTQARGNGWSNAEEVLIGNVDMSGSSHSGTEATIHIGWMDADLGTVGKGSASYGALFALKPMTFSSLVQTEVSRDTLYTGMPIIGEILSIQKVEPGADTTPEFRITFANKDTDFGWREWSLAGGIPQVFEVHWGMYCGGHFCGVPTWARVRNPWAALWVGHTGQMIGARPGMTVGFSDNDEPDTWDEGWIIETPQFGAPMDFMISEAEPFGGEALDWSDGETPAGGASDAYYNYAPVGLSLQGNEDMGRLPANWHLWGNKADVIVVKDDSGRLEAAIDAVELGAGSYVVLRMGATFPWRWADWGAASARLYWTRYGADEWTEITSGLTWVSLVNGLFALDVETVDSIPTAYPVCFRLDCPDGRFGTASWVRP